MRKFITVSIFAGVLLAQDKPAPSPQISEDAKKDYAITQLQLQNIQLQAQMASNSISAQQNAIVEKVCAGIGLKMADCTVDWKTGTVARKEVPKEVPATSPTPSAARVAPHK